VYDPSKTLISIHISKTAGTSFRAVLDQWFAGNIGHHYRSRRGVPLPDFELRPGFCIHGHFNRLRGAGVLQRFPQVHQYITIFRDPFERAVSLWNYILANPQHQHPKIAGLIHKGGTFGMWLEMRAEEGELLDDDSTLAYFPKAVDPSNIAAAFKNYIAIGLTEELEQSIRMLGFVLGKAPTLSIPLDNAGHYVPHDFAALRVRHEQLFPLEHAVYAEARKRFREQVALMA
jgi:hypothetical protein